MMATISPKKSTTTATTNDSVLNTPTVRMVPENHTGRPTVLRPANFSPSPVEQKKLKADTPPGLMAMRAMIAEMDQQLPRSLPTAPGQPSPSSPQTPEVFIIDESPPRAPVVRHRLQRQNAFIEGVTTPRGAARPPTPTEQSVEMGVKISENVLRSLKKLRKRLNYEKEEEEEMEVKEEEDHLDTDVTMRDETVRNSYSHLPVAPVLMAVKSISGLINELVHQSCAGCIHHYPSQKDHEDCMWLSWPERVDKHFDAAMTKLTEKRYFQFITHVYNMQEMFDEDQDNCVLEATNFWYFELPKKDVQSHVKSKLKEQ